MRDVAVKITAVLASPPAFSRDAWLSHTWTKGGGIPGTLVLPKPDDKRVVLPVLLEEQITEQSENEIIYKVTENGLLSLDLDPPSHRAVVSFEEQPDGGCLCTWDVKFGVKERDEFYTALTKTTVGGAMASLVRYCRPQPLRYTLVAPLARCTADDALTAWLTFIWREGGGLPLPKPWTLSSEEDGRIEILRLPHPLLKERVDKVDRAGLAAEYCVSNPGLLTFPVHSHRGRVAFEEADGEVTMRWTVDLRPYDSLGWAVRGFTSLVLTTLARNLQEHLAPGAPSPVLEEEWAPSDPSWGFAGEAWEGPWIN